MAEINVQRQHQLGLPQARQLALTWAEKAEEKFDLSCTYEEGDSSDQLSFTRAGLDGTMKVTADSIEVNAELGFLLGAFKDRIEGEIAKTLDTLLAKAQANLT